MFKNRGENGIWRPISEFSVSKKNAAGLPADLGVPLSR